MLIFFLEIEIRPNRIGVVRKHVLPESLAVSENIHSFESFCTFTSRPRLDGKRMLTGSQPKT